VGRNWKGFEGRTAVGKKGRRKGNNNYHVRSMLCLNETKERLGSGSKQGPKKIENPVQALPEKKEGMKQGRPTRNKKKRERRLKTSRSKVGLSPREKRKKKARSHEEHVSIK